MQNIRSGEWVRVLTVPPMVEEQSPPETRQLFRRCVGKILRVDGFDEYGHLELNVLDDGSQCPPGRAGNTIWIEPSFVERVLLRKPHLGKGRTGKSR